MYSGAKYIDYRTYRTQYTLYDVVFYGIKPGDTQGFHILYGNHGIMRKINV